MPLMMGTRVAAIACTNTLPVWFPTTDPVRIVTGSNSAWTGSLLRRQPMLAGARMPGRCDSRKYGDWEQITHP